ncbi:hypothetical protein GCM10020369_82820 [Cryptosporangium minutisporangium]|uniref:Uncharacterized protein n=2 Tax=Cryptosporangium minutisporangium TaxID=113569 RepID=A0ABP6TBW1_9ACTN
MHARIMDKHTLLDQELLEQHYITQINHAIATGREDLVSDLATQRDVELARSTPLRALLKRAAGHQR